MRLLDANPCKSLLYRSPVQNSLIAVFNINTRNTSELFLYTDRMLFKFTNNEGWCILKNTAIAYEYFTGGIRPHETAKCQRR